MINKNESNRYSKASPALNSRTISTAIRAYNKAHEYFELESLIEGVDLCRQDKITLCQAINLMGINFDLCLSPCQGDYRMVSFCFGNLTHPIHKVQSRAKVRKFKGLE